MKNIKVQVTYEYEIEIDESSNIVKDYESDEELINHLIDYRFSVVLPVVNHGVTVKQIEVLESSFGPNSLNNG